MMGNETISEVKFSASYSNKIKQANAEIRALSRYFERVADTNITVLEKYLQDLQNHPAASDTDHADYENINKKIEAVRFNLNVIPRPSHYPTKQQSYTDRYTAAKAILEEYAQRTKALDEPLAETQNIASDDGAMDDIGQCKALPVIQPEDFVASTPQIIASDKTIPVGGEITFTLNGIYQGISHFWLFGNYNDGDRQLSRTDCLVVNTTGLTTGKQYRVRATLTSKQREQKHVQAFFSVTEADILENVEEVQASAGQSPHIFPSNTTVNQGEKLTFSVITAGLDVIYYYWLSGNVSRGGVDQFELDTTALAVGDHEVKVSITLRDRSQAPILLRTHFTVEAAVVIPEFEEAEITVEKQQQNIQLQAPFINQESGFYSWVVDSFTGTFREVSNGEGVSHLQLENLPVGEYRARLSISYQGVTRRLEARFNIEDVADHGNTPTAQSREEFIIETAKAFAKTGNINQDMAHDTILRYLLSGEYSEERLAEDDPNKAAYYATRTRDGQDHVSHPLYLVRNQQDLAKVTSSDFFIRDFMQLQALGGSEASPYIVGDNVSVANERGGLSIIDGVAESAFANDFNVLVDAINATEYVQQHTGRVKYFSYIAHRDAIQLVPYSGNISQFAGVTMRNVIINGNTIASDANLQGIFASDGSFQNLHITNNSIQTRGNHTISISGMLSGKIEGNTNLQDEPLAANEITLYPLRIGGGANIYIMSFKNAEGIEPNDDSYYAYEEITGDQIINDRRMKKDRVNASYWKNVDLPALQTLFEGTLTQVKQLNVDKNNALAQLREENSTYAEVRITADDYQVKINEAWDNMMLQVGERDED